MPLLRISGTLPFLPATISLDRSKNKTRSCTGCHAVNVVLNFGQLGHPDKEITPPANPESYSTKVIKK